LQARAQDTNPRKALEDSVHRILAIAAVHEVLTEQREEVVELRELLERLRAMLVQGLAEGKEVHATLEPVSLAGNRATALALVFSELLQNALEHGGQQINIELVKKKDEAVLTIADDGKGIPKNADGTGLSIVQALIKDELQGRLELRSEEGTRAEVTFPA
jgi:two-component system, sensor histidine kinase PdtaS